MGKLDSLVNDGSDRRRIIVKEFPERKSQDGAFDNGKRPQRVAGGHWLEAPVEVVAGLNDTTEHFPAEAGRSLRGYFAVNVCDVAQAAVVSKLRVVTRGLRFVERLDDKAARAAQDVVAHAITMPPSTWMHWPVM